MTSSPTPTISPGIQRMIVIGLWLLAGVTAGYHLFLQLRTIPLTEPMGMWEVNYVSIARHWPDGYQWGNFVLGHDNYGPGYPLFCRPFIYFIPDIYQAHRVANLVALIAACGVLGWILRANRSTPVVTAVLVAIFYALNEGSYSVQARPDFLVMLEVLVIFALGQPSVHARRGAVGLALLLGLAATAAYLTKPYAVFAWGVVPGYLIITRQWRRALVIGGISGTVLVAGVGFYAARNPYYLFETFTAHLAHTDPDRGWLISQAWDFTILTCGVVIIALAGAALGLAKRKPSSGDDERTEQARPLPVSNSDQPACHPNARYWGIATLAAVVALLAGPGWHLGAYLTYHFHLLLAPLLVFAALECTRTTRAFPWRELALAANLGVLMALAPAPAAHDPGWDDLIADVLHQPGRVVTDFIVEPVSRQREDVVVLGMGMTAYALAEPLVVKNETPVVLRARQEAEAYELELKRQISAGGLPSALYLEYSFVRNPQDPSRWEMVPRGGLAYLLGDIMSHYTIVRSFKIHPYQFATNLPRQVSANRETQVFKLVLQSQP